MTGVAGERGATARLGNVADQEPIPTNRPGIVGEPLNEGNEALGFPNSNCARMTCQPGPVIGSSAAPTRLRSPRA
jgi:hypothetical protein